MFICWFSNSNTVFLALNEQILNIELLRPINGFTELLKEQTRPSFLRKSNGFEHVHRLIIELEHISSL